MKKLLLLLLTILLSISLFACQKENEDEGNKGCDIQEECNEEADMSEYELYVDSEDYVYVKANAKDMVRKMDNKDTFVIYFGFAKCPWCRDLMPILNEASKRMLQKEVLYVNTRENPEWKSNLDIDDYDLFVEKADEYLDYDENNIKHLYTPMVFFIKNGEIKSVITAPDYDAHEEKIPDNLKEELLNNIIEAYKTIQ